MCTLPFLVLKKKKSNSKLKIEVKSQYKNRRYLYMKATLKNDHKQFIEKRVIPSWELIRKQIEI